MPSAFHGKLTIQAWENERLFFGLWNDEDGSHGIETDRWGKWIWVNGVKTLERRLPSPLLHYYEIENAVSRYRQLALT